MSREEIDMTILLDQVKEKLENNVINGEVTLEADVVGAMVRYIEDVENLEEDTELSFRYGDRVGLTESEWEERPEGLTVGEWFRQKRSEKNK